MLRSAGSQVRYIELDEAKGRNIVSLMEKLENHDDVQNVYANFSLPKDLLAGL